MVLFGKWDTRASPRCPLLFSRLASTFVVAIRMGFIAVMIFGKQVARSWCSMSAALPYAAPGRRDKQVALRYLAPSRIPQRSFRRFRSAAVLAMGGRAADLARQASACYSGIGNGETRGENTLGWRCCGGVGRQSVSGRVCDPSVEEVGGRKTITPSVAAKNGDSHQRGVRPSPIPHSEFRIQNSPLVSRPT